MNRQVRRVAAVLLAAFMVLFAAPLYWQVVAADRVAGNPRNTRLLIEEYAIQRGQMVLADGTPVAVSVRSAQRDPLKFRREYPDGNGRRYGMITGFDSLVYGRSLAEAQFNSFLLGKAPEQFAQNLTDLVTARPSPGGTLVLTLDPKAQEAAERMLGERKGAVAALDPRTGAVLAMTTFPRYDPNELTSHDPKKVRQNWERLNADPNEPLLNRAAGQLYPPGSTFKVITAAAALEDGKNVNSAIVNTPTYTPPQTSRPIRNFGGGICTAESTITLSEAFRVSCNTTFARIGVDLGAKKLVEEAEKFGLNQETHFDLPGAARSTIPTELDPPATAQSAIGQRDVKVSPLEMAQVAAIVANGGERYAPFVVSKVVDGDDATKVVKQFEPRALGQVIPSNVAAQLRGMMGLVVSNGTGTRAQIDGVQVFGKTGTAQQGLNRPPHSWFIGFASQGDKSIAVAVVVEGGGDLGSEATGGAVAAPIAREVISAHLGVGT
ncbi:MAG: penicillin-binding protein 2 [Sporichthyaceae bacterium]|nr:penicillin-binding protein 2 [Sporichthyaceae bacterium]